MWTEAEIAAEYHRIKPLSPRVQDALAILTRIAVKKADEVTDADLDELRLSQQELTPEERKELDAVVNLLRNVPP
jgi:hypothetical protein